jgi:hypothetical protein
MRRVAPSVWLGGQVVEGRSEDMSFHKLSFVYNTSPTMEYDYDMETSTFSASVLGQVSWLSSGDSGFLVGALIGATQIKSSLSGTRVYKELASLTPLESVSLSQTLSSIGMSGGLQLGYIWTFDSGFSLGIVGNGISTLAKFESYESPATNGVHDSETFNSVLDDLNNQRDVSSAAIVLGFAF